MSLRGACTICTDYFDAENDISVTPCGHLFHAVCLNQWIVTCTSRSTCPQCRRSILPKRIIGKIFINTPEEDQDDLDPYVLKNKLDELDGCLKKASCEKSDLKSSLKAMEEAKDNLMAKVKQLKAENKREKNTVHLLKSDIETLTNELSHSRAIKEEMKQLKLRLKTLEKVEICINGQKSDVDEMMNRYSQNASSSDAKELAVFCVAMKQEYETIKESRNKLSNEVMKLKREIQKKSELLVHKLSAVDELKLANSNLMQSEEALTKENRSLQLKVKSLQQAIVSPTDTKASAINRLIFESPAPEVLTPVNGLPVRKPKLLRDNDFVIKKPKLSSSFETVDVDLNDSGTTVNANQIRLPLFIPETPDDKSTSTKNDTDTSGQKENLLQGESVKSKQDFRGRASACNPLSTRKKLLANKKVHEPLVGYDGLGGHKRQPLQKSCLNVPSSTKLFSSSHTSLFKQAASLKTGKKENRFDRLKRIHRK